MKIIEIEIAKIKEAAYNPRQKLKPGDHRYEVIKQSLNDFDLVEPLVWNERTGNLIGGHQRFSVLKARGDKKVTVSVVDLPPEKEKALNVTLNNPGVAGEWDPDGLQILLQEIEENTPDLYDALDMAALAKDVRPEHEVDTDEAVDELEDGPPDMELQPYEHYDYIVAFFKDSRDFMAALDHFGIKRQEVPAYVGSKKIGIGRVIDGAKYLQRLRDDQQKRPDGSNPKQKKS